jgi:hypothetical protein
MPQCRIELQDIFANTGSQTVLLQFIADLLSFRDILDRNEIARNLHSIGLVADLLNNQENNIPYPYAQQRNE